MLFDILRMRIKSGQGIQPLGVGGSSVESFGEALDGW
jgi:hypothetical protein